MSVDQSKAAAGSSPAASYEQVLDAAPDAMVLVSSDGLMAFVNLQTEKLFGYQRSELLGRSFELLIPDRFHARHKIHVARFNEKPAARSMGSGLELFARRKDGTEVPVEVSLGPVQGPEGLQTCVAIRDVTERKRIEALAKVNADRLASAVETVQDAFALFDSADRLLLCNSVYRRLLGEHSRGPLVGRTYEEILSTWVKDLAFDSDEARTRFTSERMARRRDPESTFDVRTRDGRSLRVTDRHTAEGGIVKTIWDLTQDVRLADELREARQAADAASTAKSEFLASMSHELRTPLNAILGFAQLLQRDRREPLSDRHKERASQIMKGGEHLLRLIDDILDLSRIEAGGISISTEPVNVGEVIDEVRATLEPMAERAGIRLEVEKVPALPPASADRTRFAQILMNLASNALKYNRPGGAATLRVMMPEERRIRVSVIDTGIGIPADQQDKLFQPFQRAGQETGPIEGTGIGLVITKRLAELMGGRVGFQSTPGVGSEFWVELDVRSPTSAPPTSTAVDKREGAALRGQGHRLVVYVEDNPANVTFMRDVLGEFEALELVTAPTAEMGIELVRGRLPDVVIMDINLPGISGFEALRVLREDPSTKDVPVIALTAAAAERERERGLQAGFYRYLTKPVNVDELVVALEALLAPKS
ncbi:MAG: PAS domain S-box protein [Polyangiaceae bacterium]